jgi:6-phosphogluconolactonase
MDLSNVVYVGTYTQFVSPAGEKAEGIYVYRLDPAVGSLRLEQVVKDVFNPSYLAFHPSGRFLYAVNEAGETGGKPGGGVSAFSVDPQTGVLNFLNQQLSIGVDPCYISIDRGGRYALVANYTSGTVSLLPVNQDGSLQPAAQTIQHVGRGKDPSRQEGPHAHAAVLSPDNRFVFVMDLGTDRVVAYRLDRETGKLVPRPDQDVQVAPGSGPRHLDFHPNGRFAYLVNELNSSLVGCAFDPKAGRLEEMQVVPMLPEGYRGSNLAADVHVAPNGKFLYATNRGHDSLVIYALDADSGRLTFAGYEPTGGNYPRNFAIDPTGTFLLAANQNSGTILTFWIDAQTGKLSFTGQETQVPTPACIKFYQEA